jgi:hypothetical protein
MLFQINCLVHTFTYVKNSIHFLHLFT